MEKIIHIKVCGTQEEIDTITDELAQFIEETLPYESDIHTFLIMVKEQLY